MRGTIGYALLILAAPTGAAAQEAMTRVLACKGPDASMELFLPEAVVHGKGELATRLKRPVLGRYTLDLSAANKGKSLEAVRVRLSPDGKGVIVDQFTRKLPPTTVPLTGGVVDFDKRFGTKAKCGPFGGE